MLIPCKFKVQQPLFMFPLATEETRDSLILYFRGTVKISETTEGLPMRNATATGYLHHDKTSFKRT